MKEIHINPASIVASKNKFIAYEGMYTTALEHAKESTPFADITSQAAHITSRLRGIIQDTEQRLGVAYIDAVKNLTAEGQIKFYVAFKDLYTKRNLSDRPKNLLLGRLLRNGRIPLEYINPDGTFQADKISKLDYFLDNPHLVETLDLYSRQLSIKSKMRQRAIARHEVEHPSHDHEDDHSEAGGSCCPTHRKSEMRQLRARRRLNNHPWLAAISANGIRYGMFLLCPGDDFANLGNNIYQSIVPDQRNEAHQYQEPNGVIPRRPLDFVEEEGVVYVRGKSKKVKSEVIHAEEESLLEDLMTTDPLAGEQKIKKTIFKRIRNYIQTKIS